MSEIPRHVPAEAKEFSMKEQKEKSGLGKEGEQAMQGYIERPEVTRSPESQPAKRPGQDAPPGTNPVGDDPSLQANDSGDPARAGNVSDQTTDDAEKSDG